MFRCSFIHVFTPAIFSTEILQKCTFIRHNFRKLGQTIKSIDFYLFFCVTKEILLGHRYLPSKEF